MKGLELDEKALDKLSPNEQDKVFAALRGLEEVYENNPLAFYEPHEKQQPFHAARTPIKVFLGGNQSGKTTAGLADDLIQAVDRSCLPEHLQQYKRYEPPFLCRVMCPSFPVMETVIHVKLEELVPKEQLVGNRWSRAYDKQLRILHFKNGSKIFFNTYEQDVKTLGGATLHRVHYDEEPPQRHRNESRIRVMRKGGDEMFTMTPVDGLTWSHEAIFQSWEKGNDEITLVQVDMDDNPYLGEAEKERALEGLSDEERQARKEGKYVALHGRIYHMFDEEEHVVPERPLPFGVHVVVAIDPGISQQGGCGVVWGAVNRSDTVTIFEEMLVSNWDIGQVCDEIHRINNHYEITPIYYVIDPAARDKHFQTGRSDQMEFADHGINAYPGQNAVDAGLSRVKERLRKGMFFVQENCPQTIEEFRRYRWKEPPRSGEDGKPRPFKRDDHILDAIRYLIMSRPYLPSENPEDHRSQQEKWMQEDQEKAFGEDMEHEFGPGILL